mmetsp:Transcript_23475/g.45851  ORF Transcript_23475/g.45851 Transcript_23475/m.45851 type:complete len:237 (-) Transcript_23475:154-864(-)
MSKTNEKAQADQGTEGRGVMPSPDNLIPIVTPRRSGDVPLRMLFPESDLVQSMVSNHPATRARGVQMEQLLPSSAVPSMETKLMETTVPPPRKCCVKAVSRSSKLMMLRLPPGSPNFHEMMNVESLTFREVSAEDSLQLVGGSVDAHGDDQRQAAGPHMIGATIPVHDRNASSISLFGRDFEPCIVQEVPVPRKKSFITLFDGDPLPCIVHKASTYERPRDTTRMIDRTDHRRDKM